MRSKLILIIFLINSVYLLGGAWSPKKGSGFYKIDFRFLSGEKIYNNNGDKIDIAKFTDMTLGFYGEYGFTDDFAVTAYVPVFKKLKYDLSPAPFDTDVSGFGDLKIGGKFNLTEFKQSVFSAEIILGVPTGKSDPDGGLLTGDGEFNQSINFQFGHSFFPNPFYISAIAEFNNRTEGFSDEIFFGVEAGYSFAKNFLLIVRIKRLESLNNGETSKLGGFGIYQNNQEYLAYGPELVYNFNDNFGISAMYESGTAGRNIISAPVYTFGIFFKN